MKLNGAIIERPMTIGSKVFDDSYEFIKALRSSNDILADTYIDGHRVATSNVSFSEENGWLIANTHFRFSLDAPLLTTSVMLRLYKAAHKDMPIMSTMTLVKEYIEVGDQEAEIHFNVISVHPYNSRRKASVPSRFSWLRSFLLTAAKLSDLPTDDSVDPEPDPEPSPYDDDANYVKLGDYYWYKTNLDATDAKPEGEYYALGEPYYKSVYNFRGYLWIANNVKYTAQGASSSSLNPVTYEFGSIENATKQCKEWVIPDEDNTESRWQALTPTDVDSKGVFTVKDGVGTIKLTTIVDGESCEGYDAAYNKSGGKCMIPSKAQVLNLWSSTNKEFYQSDSGLYIIKLKDINHPENYIEIPLAGRINSLETNWDGDGGGTQVDDSFYSCALTICDGYIPAGDGSIACKYICFAVDVDNNVIENDAIEVTCNNSGVGLSIRPVKVTQESLATR